MRGWNPNLPTIPRLPQPDTDWLNPIQRNPFGTAQEQVAGRFALQPHVPGMATNWNPIPRQRPGLNYGLDRTQRGGYGFG